MQPRRILCPVAGADVALRPGAQVAVGFGDVRGDDCAGRDGRGGDGGQGAMAGPLRKKLGLEVTSEKVDGRGRVYTLK